MERRYSMMAGYGRRLETNLDIDYQTVPNQGLLIPVPIFIKDYVLEGWFDSRCFATIFESRVLLSLTHIRLELFNSGEGASVGGRLSTTVSCSCWRQGRMTILLCLGFVIKNTSTTRKR